MCGMVAQDGGDGGGGQCSSDDVVGLVVGRDRRWSRPVLGRIAPSRGRPVAWSVCLARYLCEDKQISEI